MEIATNATDVQVWTQFVEKLIKEDSGWPSLVLPILLVIIFVVGLGGNLLTCIVIYYDRTMHTATNYYLFNLAVSDLVVTFAIPLEVYEILLNYQIEPNIYSDLACQVHFFLVVALWNNGILIMTALAVERYIAICHPLMIMSAPVWRRVLKAMIIIWVIVLVESLPDAVTINLVRTGRVAICFVIPTPYARTLNGVLAVATFLLPLGIMTFLYGMIAFQMKVAQKNKSMDRIFNDRDNRKKVNKLIALTISFLVCWLPFFILRLLYFMLDDEQLMDTFDKWWNHGYNIAMINSWCSAVLNPLLFSLISTKFRNSLKNLWNKKVRWPQWCKPWNRRSTAAV